MIFVAKMQRYRYLNSFLNAAGIGVSNSMRRLVTG